MRLHSEHANCGLFSSMSCPFLSICLLLAPEIADCWKIFTSFSMLALYLFLSRALISQFGSYIMHILNEPFSHESISFDYAEDVFLGKVGHTGFIWNHFYGS